MFNCRICGKEYETLEEAMDCEQKCYAKRKEDERQRKIAEVKVKEEQRRAAAQVDTARIQLQYDDLIKGIKHHVEVYGEPVKLGSYYYGKQTDRDPFTDFCNEFNKVFNRGYF